MIDAASSVVCEQCMRSYGSGTLTVGNRQRDSSGWIYSRLTRGQHMQLEAAGNVTYETCPRHREARPADAAG